MIKRGDIITLKGQSRHDGKVLEIKTDKQGNIKSYVVDRGHRTSEIWANNVIEHIPGKAKINCYQGKILSIIF